MLEEEDYQERTQEDVVNEEGHHELYSPEVEGNQGKKHQGAPGDRPPKEESLMTTRGTLIHQGTLEYLSRMKPEDHQNLTRSEVRGLKKLKRRVKNRAIVKYLTNKSNKFCVTSMESYTSQGKKHTAGDVEIILDEVTRIHKNLTRSEVRGLKKLKRRVKNREIVIYLTDKSNKFFAASMESDTRQ